MYGPVVDAAFKAEAMRAWPSESCGLICGDVPRFVACKNIAEDPLMYFKIGPADYLRAQKEAGDIVAVVHSHTVPRPPTREHWMHADAPTEQDMESQLASGLPWGILVTDGEGTTEPFWFGDQVPMPPLLGRVFRHGVTDCYSLIRDWYRLERKVVLPEFPRDDGWWKKEQDLYRDGFRKAGFIAMDVEELIDPQIGDVFLAQVRSDVPNHGGVYIGDGLVVHHLEQHLSIEAPIHPWRKRITHWLRYQPRKEEA